MKDLDATRRSQLIAGLLIAAGALLLLSNLGWFGGFTAWLWALLFLAGGGAFLMVYNADRNRWWALIPAFGLLALGAAALMGDAGGALFLAILGVGFAAVYASNRRRWWAIIPAGVLGTLAVVAWLEELRPGFDAGWLFFLGLAATFAALAYLPDVRQRWAVWPALGVLVLAVITLLSSSFGSIILPLVLIVGGGLLLWRQSRNDSAERDALEPRDRARSS